MEITYSDHESWYQVAQRNNKHTFNPDAPLGKNYANVETTDQNYIRALIVIIQDPKRKHIHKQAFSKLILCMHNFIVSFAMKFKTYSVDELYGCLCEGIRTAALEFDISSGYQFSSFAIWKLRGALSALRYGDALIQVPASKSFTEKRTYIDIQDALKVSGHTFAQTDTYLLECHGRLLMEHFAYYLQNLDIGKTEKQFINHWFQELCDGNVPNLSSIGARMGVSRERARQLRNSARKKLTLAIEELKN